jgi:hypothetical protein
MGWYWGHFACNEEDKQRGEIAPTYFDSDKARCRLRMFKGLKVIVLVRDPIERTYSLFRHHRSKGRVPNDYFAAIEQMPRIESSGKYAIWCGKWEADFGSDHVLYLLQDEIESNPQMVFDRLCEFLGVQAMVLPKEASKRFGQATQPKWPIVTKACAGLSTQLRSIGLNRPIEIAKSMGLRSLLIGKAMGHEEMPTDIRDRLTELYRDDIDWLEKKVGRPVTRSWR